MNVRMPTGLDFVAARIHGRRSRMAEAERLDALCRIRSIPELARALYGETGIETAVDLQRRMVEEQYKEVRGLAQMVGPAGEPLLDWLCTRFQVENLKVLARGFVVRAAVEQVQPYLVPLERDLALDGRAMVSAETIEDFARLIPVKIFADSVRRIMEVYALQPKPFFIESALDRAYFCELLARAEAAGSEESETILPLVRQEVDIFHLMLATRGKCIYELKPELLMQFHVKGAGIRRDRLSAMLSATDFSDIAARAAGIAIDLVSKDHAAQAGGPAKLDAPVLEAMAWNRLLNVANSTFRRSHMGLGAVVAYTAIRRVELANLITLTEGIRANVAPETLRPRLVPRTSLEGVRV